AGESGQSGEKSGAETNELGWAMKFYANKRQTRCHTSAVHESTGDSELPPSESLFATADYVPPGGMRIPVGQPCPKQAEMHSGKGERETTGKDKPFGRL